MITEPTTMVTDYILGAVSLILGQRLMIFGLRERQRSVLLWGMAFFATATAAIFGGTYHGFLNHLSQSTEYWLWKITMVSTGVMSLCMVSGSLTATVRSPYRAWLIAGLLLKFVLFLIFTSMDDDFRVVVFDYIPAMLAVFILHLLEVSKSGSQRNFWIAGGVAVSFLAAWLQQSGVTLHRHFNHNDLYHMAQTIAMFVFFNGAIVLRDRSG